MKSEILFASLQGQVGNRRTLLALIASLSLAAVAHADRRPNVILISVDTLRADHVGCYGYEKPTTPFIDSLAERGVRFDNAFCQATWTLPSHISMLTSRYPRSHSVQTDKGALPNEVCTLAESMGDAGYSTTAFISWVYVSSKFGIARGFQKYHELVPPKEKLSSSTHESIKAGPFVDEVIHWVDSAPTTPFFLFLHLFDPHIDYEPPPPYDSMFAADPVQREFGTWKNLKQYVKEVRKDPKRIPPDQLPHVKALYDGEIRYVDDQLKRLFDHLSAKSLLENTLVVFTSDHGEEHDDHGSMEGHQWTLYDETLRIPLIIRFPRNQNGGTVVEAVTQTIDIAPTILNVIGASIPEEFEGRNLVPIVENGGEDDGRVAYSELDRFNKKWGLRTHRYKMIYTQPGTNKRGVPLKGGYELYDLLKDPSEQVNLYNPETAFVKGYQTMLDDWVTKGLEAKPTTVAKPDLTDEDVARLKSLGYVE